VRVPGVVDGFTFATRENVEAQLDLGGICRAGGHALQVGHVGVIHRDDGVGPIKVFCCDGPGTMLARIETVGPHCPESTGMGMIALFLGTGGNRSHLELVRQMMLIEQIVKDSFSHGGTTDIT